MEISELRDQIDGIDDRLAALFKRRMELAGLVAEEKAKTGAAVLSPEREREILYRVTGIAGGEFEDYTKNLYSTLFDLSRSYQTSKLRKGDSLLRARIEAAIRETPEAFSTRVVAACQGMEGAYSQQACDKLFSVPQILYFSRFQGVFQAVESGMCRYGVLPIENSLAGSVTDVYDLMVRYNFYIVRSIRLKIDHCLLALPGAKLSDISEIISHEQALNQCSDFLKANPGIRVTVAANTASASQFVAQSGRRDLASIASPSCAGLYGLSAVSDRIQNSDHNYTRFICISKKLEIYPGASKISFMASVAHKPGSLYGLLSKFSSHGINVSKIESRPIPGRDFEFRFYFDIEAPLDSPDTLNVLSQLEDDEGFVFLGGYTEKV